MLNRNIILVFVSFCAIMLFCMPVQAQSSPQGTKMNNEEIIALLPRGTDMLDEKDVQRYEQLVKMGATAYPALSSELLNTTDEITASRIISIFVESKGDKTVPRETIRKLVSKWDSSTRHGKAIREVSAEALGKIGTKEDVSVLFSLLDDKDKSVQIQSLRSLAKVGDEQSIQQIRVWIVKRRGSMSREEQDKDSSIHEAERAAEVIQHRSVKGGQ